MSDVTGNDPSVNTDEYNIWCHDKYVLNETTNSAITQEYVGQVIDFLKDDRVPEQFDRFQKAAFSTR